MLKRILVVMVVILVLSALFAMTVAAQGTGDPAKGKAAWAATNCKGCHGENGEGKYAGVRAGDGKTAADWIKQSRTPRANMPAYTAAQISDTLLTDMWAYMQTLPKPASFTPVSTTVPAGALPGQQLWVDKRCVACHANVQALVKSRFVDQNREVTTEAVLKQLRTPAKNMPMFSATQVTDPQAAQIADYLKAQAAIVKAAAVVTPTAPVTPTVAAKDIVDTAVADGRFKTLVAAVQAAGLVDTLKGKGPFTVFAPTDEAFAKLPAGTVEALLKDPAKLKDILLYHVVSGNVMAADAAKLTSANTVQGKPITIKAEGGKIMINDATVAIPDVKTSNGVIHVIDRVILPPAAPAAAAAAPAPATMPKTGADLSLSAQVTTTKPVTATAPVTPTVAVKDIVDTAVADGRFKTLVAAVQAAGLVDTLKGKGPFTVFAPTDEAFAKLPAGTVEALLKDPAKLKDILLYHVVSGNVMAADAAKLTSANTVQGKPITIKAEGGKIMINDATVAIPDVKTSNGVIHVIDRVILPPAAPAAAAPVTATKATTATVPAAAAPAPATMPKTGADLSLSAQVTTTKPVTATAPVTPTVAAKDIVDTAVADGRFKTLVAAVQAAGLVDTLKGKGPFTVFAPTDEAFAKLPAGTVEALLKDPAKLKDILLYHVVSGNVMAADAAKLTSANTVQGKPITIKAEGGKLMINDATVAIADVKTSNGVIHVIDRVILPPAAAAPVTATKATTATVPAAAAAPAPAPATMPKTGGEMGLLVLSGLSLLGISAGLAIRGRRR